MTKQRYYGHTGERIIPDNFKQKEDYLLYLRHLFAYKYASERLSTDDIVLEVGAGEGYGASLLSKYVKEIIALDNNASTIFHAKRKYSSDNLNFIWYDGKKVPFKDCTFDAVISFQVIEHVEDDARFLSEIHRVLKNGGILILTTPNRTYRLRPGQKPWNPFHVREYHPHELENLLKATFREINVQGIRGNDEIQRIEIKRVKPNLIISFDILNLRRLLPDFIKKGLAKIISKKKAGKLGNADFRLKYSTEDFYIADDATQSLDLLGTCKK